MTVKVLLDPVLTTPEPGRCSTYIQFYTFVQRVLEQRSDVFFYWLVPAWVTAGDREWLPQHPNVRYFDTPQHKDRTKEYVTLRDAMDLKIAFNGELWDFDIMLTVRSGMVPLFKMVSTSPRAKGHAWSKEIWVIEEMPMFKFKTSVAVLHPDCHELFTLSGYLTAERVFLMSYHEKPKIIDAARNYLSPSRVRELDAKLRCAVPTQRSEFMLKDERFFYRPGGDKPFCISFVGRMGKGGANLDKVYNAMTNAWVLRGDTVRLLVLTTSTGGEGLPPEHIELQRAPREEFWRIAREEMHVLCILYAEAQFLLSLIEPLMFGVPAIVQRAPWSMTFLGTDYPFFASGEIEAYTLMKLFYEDYPGMYARFIKWQQEFFVPVFTARFENDLLYSHLVEGVDTFDRTMVPRFRAAQPGRELNEIVIAVVKAVADLDEFVLFDVLERLSSSKVLRSLGVKLKLEDRSRRGLVWATAWNDFRLILKAFHGWEDASAQVGHMRRVRPAPETAA